MDKKIIEKLIKFGLITNIGVNPDNYKDVNDLIAKGVITIPGALSKINEILGKTDAENVSEVIIDNSTVINDTPVDITPIDNTPETKTIIDETPKSEEIVTDNENIEPTVIEHVDKNSIITEVENKEELTEKLSEKLTETVENETVEETVEETKEEIKEEVQKKPKKSNKKSQ